MPWSPRRRRRKASWPDLDERLTDEACHAWSLWKGGLIREGYLRTDRPGVALMLETTGVDGAHALLEELPLVRAGLIEFECLSLDAYVGFDALLEGSLDERPALLNDPTDARDRSRTERKLT